MLGLSRDVTGESAGMPGSDQSGGNGPRLTTKEAAAYLGVAESTLEKWRCSGSGPEFERVGTRIVRYRIPALENFLVARRAMPRCAATHSLSEHRRSAKDDLN
jgi:excisionase family DNA binding protein